MRRHISRLTGQAVHSSCLTLSKPWIASVARRDVCRSHDDRKEPQVAVEAGIFAHGSGHI